MRKCPSDKRRKVAGWGCSVCLILNGTPAAYDYLLKIRAPDMKYYQQFLLHVLGTIGYPDSLGSTFVMDELKQPYDISPWGHGRF